MSFEFRGLGFGVSCLGIRGSYFVFWAYCSRFGVWGFGSEYLGVSGAELRDFGVGLDEILLRSSRSRSRGQGLRFWV